MRWRHNSTDCVIERNIITRFECVYDGEQVFAATFHPGIAANPILTFHTRAEVDTLLADWEVELLGEEEDDSVTPRGTEKHWHIWHIVARRS